MNATYGLSHMCQQTNVVSVLFVQYTCCLCMCQIQACPNLLTVWRPLPCSLSEEEYSDDEDVSWKVRRAAAKCLQAIIACYPDLLKDIYPQAVSALIARFKEREENVKSDIFQTFVELVKQIGRTNRRYEAAAGSKPIDQLRSDVPSIMKAAVKQLRDKSIKTKQGMFAALQELVSVTPESLGPFIPQVMPGIQAALQVHFYPPLLSSINQYILCP